LLLWEKKEVSAQSRQAAKGFFLCTSAPLRAKEQKNSRIAYTYSRQAPRRCEKKRMDSRKDAKPQRVFLCTPKNKFTKSLPVSGRSLKSSPISLRLCAFARQTKKNWSKACLR
jgi:hypothetical protein